MADVEAKGCCLWLMPEGEVTQRLNDRIQVLAARFGTSSFAPHVTLVSGLELPESDAYAAAARAAAAMQPFTVVLGDVEGGDEHFRCLFLRVKDDGRLRAAHASAARAFGREPAADFLPHLSLVYGTLTPAEKRMIARRIGDDLRLHFDVRRFHLWRTEGPVTTWRRLGVFDLRQVAEP